MLDSLLFKKNRKKLVKNLVPGAMCVFESNDQMPTNADGLMPFRQNNNLFNLTGNDQEDTSLIIFPETKNQDYKEVLFIKKTNDTIRVWEGHKLTKEEAKKKVLYTNRFSELAKDFIQEKQFSHFF